MSFRYFALLGMLFVLSSCVPKTEYEDQQAKLKDYEAKIKELEDSSGECNKEAYLQLREQVQNLDLINQELVEKNTALSKDVSQMRVAESSGKVEAVSCDQKVKAQATESEQKLERIRVTYEVTLKDLKGEIDRLKSSLEKEKEKTAKLEASKASKARKSKAKPSGGNAQSEAPSHPQQ